MLVLHLPQGTRDQSQLAFEERLVLEQPTRMAEPKLCERDLDLLRELAGVVAAVRNRVVLSGFLSPSHLASPLSWLIVCSIGQKFIHGAFEP